MASNSGRSVVTVQSGLVMRPGHRHVALLHHYHRPVRLCSLRHQIRSSTLRLLCEASARALVRRARPKNSPVGSVIVSLRSVRREPGCGRSSCSGGSAAAPRSARTHTGGRRRRGRSLRPPRTRTNRLAGTDDRRRSAWRPSLDHNSAMCVLPLSRWASSITQPAPDASQCADPPCERSRRGRCPASSAGDDRGAVTEPVAPLPSQEAARSARCALQGSRASTPSVRSIATGWSAPYPALTGSSRNRIRKRVTPMTATTECRDQHGPGRSPARHCPRKGA